MWIFDSYYKYGVEFRGRERVLARASAAYPPSFYMLLKDPPAHREMIEALEPFQGRGMQLQNHLRHLPGPPELRRQKSGREDRDSDPSSGRGANVDVHQNLRYIAERDLFPYEDRDKSRLSPDFQIP